MLTKKQNDTFTLCLFIVYCIGLIWAIVFKFQLDLSSLEKFRILNFIPFRYSRIDGSYAMDIANMIAFIPFGLFLSMLEKKPIWIILYGMAASIAFECTQYLLMIGISDLTDVMSNIAGAVIGIIIYKLLLLLADDRVYFNKLLNYAALLLLVSVIVFLHI